MKRRLISGILIALAAFCAGGCIYDYTPVVDNQQSVVVIEGDILIGAFTEVRVSSSRRLETSYREMPVTEWPDRTYAWVEASDGTRYNGVRGRIDTRGADPSLEYRLVVDYRERTYASEWQTVNPGATLDDVSYSISDDGRTLTVDVTAHGDAGNLYYRWIAKEDWEYHTPYSASVYYVPAGTTDHGTYYQRAAVLPYRDGENSYFCWDSGSVPDVLLASAEDLSENRIIRRELYSIGCRERRISYIYSVEITQISLTETAYRYWENMKKNSGDVGGLFSPEPFGMRGNIICQENADEMVVGYVSVAVPSVKRLFIYGEETGFYKMPDEEREIYSIAYPYSIEKAEWNRYYRNGYVPYMHTPMGGPEDFDWIIKRCVDCTVWGSGTKNKPDFWPNDHK